MSQTITEKKSNLAGTSIIYHKSVTPRACDNFMKDERSRYKRKGFGLMFAALFAVSFFMGVPTIYAQLIWPEIMALKEYY
jgi:hypothetical protein